MGHHSLPTKPPIQITESEGKLIVCWSSKSPKGHAPGPACDVDNSQTTGGIFFCRGYPSWCGFLWTPKEPPSTTQVSWSTPYLSSGPHKHHHHVSGSTPYFSFGQQKDHHQMSRTTTKCLGPRPMFPMETKRTTTKCLNPRPIFPLDKRTTTKCLPYFDTYPHH